VPAAVLFDLKQGDRGTVPTAFGAASARPPAPMAEVGAGAGATAGLKGGWARRASP
jgi:L-aminopeptidase/D-esterase-like protein